MKNRFIAFVSLIAIAGFLIIIVNACSKNDDDHLATSTINYKYTEFMPAKEDILPLITKFNFAHKQHKLGYKSGEDMPLNEALWNLEAGVNYEFRSSKESIDVLYYDSSFVTLPVYTANGEVMIAGNDILNAYGDLLMFTANEVSSINNGELKVANVELEELDASGATFKTEVVAGSEGGWNPCQVNSNDYWFATSGAGKCEPYSGYEGTDAADRINFILNCIDYACNGYVYFTSISEESLVYEWDLLWNGNYDECLNPTALSGYLNNANTVIDMYQPDEKDFIYCDFQDELLGPNGWTHYFYVIRYGIINCSGSGS